MQNYITGLDVGTHSIKAAVAEIKRDGKLNLIKLFKMPSSGIRRGIVDDIAEATKAINQALGEIKKVSPKAIKNIYIGFGGSDVKVRFSRGMVIVSRADSEIHQDDVDRAVDASAAVNLPANRMTLHSLISEYIVDGVGEIKDPIGMIGNKLEVNSVIIDAFSPAVKNLMKCVEIAGGKIAGVILAPIASSRSVLSKNQKDLGVVLIDIGAGKTGVSVYEEGKLLHAAIFPVGSSNITNDLAIGVKSDISAAEILKLTFGSALTREVPAREMIDLKKISASANGLVSRRLTAEIIELRLAEILEFVDNELKKIGKNGKLPAGIVLVGGGAKMPSLVDLTRRELRLAAQVGSADASLVNSKGAEPSSQIEDPEFACVLGLLFAASDNNLSDFSGADPLKIGFFKKIIKYFIP